MAIPTRLNPTFESLGWDIQPDDRGLVRLTLLGRRPVKVQPPLTEAVRAMDVVLAATGYENPCDWIGSWNYRAIAGTDGLASGHAYGVCIDLDYGGDNPESPDHPLVDNNPHMHRRIVPGDPGFGTEWQILEHQVRALEAIRNTAGQPMWSWRIGWVLGDSMHWQPGVGPEDCEVDWTTVYTGEEPPMANGETYNDWVEGWVTGLDAEHVTKLVDSGIVAGDASVWIALLDDPGNWEWRYFYTRAQASTWAKIGEL
jgi:hypothetical protein